MATPDPSFFDAHARLDAASRADLENLVFFGTVAVVTTAHDGYPGSSADDLIAHLEALATDVPARLKAAGLVPYVALGVHPAKIPWLGLEAVLARMPSLLGRPEVVALGEIGLEAGGEREEDVLGRQVEMALALRMKLVVTLPEAGREKALKRTLAILRDAEVPPEQALLVRVDAKSVATVRGVGYRVALGAMPAEEAAQVIARHGPEGILLASEAGDGPSDPLHLSRVAQEMEKAGLSRAVVRRVAFENAEAFYGVRPREG